MGRTDDIINVAGHRLSTGAMEEVLASQPGRRRMCGLGRLRPGQGRSPARIRRPEGGVIKDPGADRTGVIALVRQKIGPIASFKSAAVVKRLPKTRSGKILRGTIKKIADGVPYNVPGTIDDPVILTEITETLNGMGYPKK